MTISKKTLSAAVLSGVLALSAGAAFAWCGGYGPGVNRIQGQEPPCVQPGCAYAGQQHPHFRGNYPRGYHQKFGNYESRKTYLRGLLNLSDAQKPAFDAYLAAVDATHARPAVQANPNASRQDLLNQRIERQKARLATLEKVAQARAELVKVLTPEQAAALDSFESRSHSRAYNRGPAYHGMQGPAAQ